MTIAVIAISFALAAQPGKGKGNHGGPKGNKGMKAPGGKGPKIHQGKPIKVQHGKPMKAHPGNNKSFGKPGKAGKHYAPKPNGKPGKHGGKPLYHSKYHFDKGHVNHVYMYAYTPFIYPTKNYGQWRSQQARNKHKKYPVVLELNVLNGILLVRERNVFIISEIDRKINLFHSLVIARHKAGLITDVQFNIHLTTIRKMKARRAHYHYS